MCFKSFKKAKLKGYEEHQVVYVEKSFDWDNFDTNNSNLSLFSEKKLSK